MLMHAIAVTVVMLLNKVNDVARVVFVKISVLYLS